MGLSPAWFSLGSPGRVTQQLLSLVRQISVEPPHTPVVKTRVSIHGIYFEQKAMSCANTSLELTLHHFFSQQILHRGIWIGTAVCRGCFLTHCDCNSEVFCDLEVFLNRC